MDVIEQITSKSEFFYKRSDLPIVKVGDKVKVLNYLELPSDEDSPSNKDKKKEKRKTTVIRGSNNFAP
jgi:hypothetical protein